MDYELPIENVVYVLRNSLRLITGEIAVREEGKKKKKRERLECVLSLNCH